MTLRLRMKVKAEHGYDILISAIKDQSQMMDSPPEIDLITENQ
jgi:hypothetical protein